MKPILCLLIALLAGAQLNAQPDILSREVSVVEHRFAKEKASRVSLILSETPERVGREPGRHEWKDRLRASAAKHDASLREAVDDFISKDSAESSWNALSLPGVRLIVVPNQQLRRIFSAPDGWDDFRSRFGSTSLHTISRVGFSKDGRTAIYFTYVQYDWTSGFGHFHVVREHKGSWKLDDTAPIGWSVTS